MKYLFDTLTKNTLTLAKLYKYIKEGDEFILYDPNSVPVEGFDVELLSHIECKMIDNSDVFNMRCDVVIPNFDKEDIEEINNTPVYKKEIFDNRKMKSTLDFDKALEWCDCYVTLVNPEGELNTASNIETKTEELKNLFDRINKALELNKKIYLGTNANSEFNKIISEYKNCINEKITEDSLAEVLKYKSGFFLRDKLGRTKITFLIGTSTMSGKMSSTFKTKEMYENKNNEKVAVICTEEIYPFFDTEKYLIYSFCRNFSELTLDKEIMYLRCLIEKIIYDCKPQRIIIASQGTFSYPQTMTNYNYEDVKPHGMLANMLLSCIGCDSVIICSSWKNLDLVKKLIDFFNASYIEIDGVNISPLHLVPATLQPYNGYLFKMNSVVEDDTFMSYILGFLVEYPWIKINCDYMNSQQKVNEFLNSKEFFDMYKSYWTTKVIDAVKAKGKEQYLETLNEGLEEEKHQLTENELKIIDKVKKNLNLL